MPKTVYDEFCELPYQKLAIDAETWLIVQSSHQSDLLAVLKEDLDAGEAEAITLALEIKADYLIIDERKGRNKAEALGLRIVGLLGVLVQAKQSGYLTAVEPVLTELRNKAGFRIHPALYKRIVEIAGEVS